MCVAILAESPGSAVAMDCCFTDWAAALQSCSALRCLLGLPQEVYTPRYDSDPMPPCEAAQLRYESERHIWPRSKPLSDSDPMPPCEAVKPLSLWDPTPPWLPPGLLIRGDAKSKARVALPIAPPPPRSWSGVSILTQRPKWGDAGSPVNSLVASKPR